MPHALVSIRHTCIAAAVGVALTLPAVTQGGAKITIGEDATIDLGFRLQTFFLVNDDDVAAPRDENEFRVRRARIRLGADVGDWFSLFLQTEAADDPDTTGGSGEDMRLIDAFINFHPHDLFQVYTGEHMSPASRQNLTSSGGLMAWDRPLQNNKTLTWGTRAIGALQTRTLAGTGAGLDGDVDVRDLGVTLFGATPLSEGMSGKYYIGAYQGSDTAVGDGERFTVRGQLNFGDPEPGYFNLSTYVGGKRTIGVGVAYDTQDEVALDETTGGAVDYEWWTLDGFVEQPLGGGTVTLEAAWNSLDLDGAGFLTTDTGSRLAGATASQAAGEGFYLQAGYYVPGRGSLPGGWQPWVLYEQWDSDDADDLGSYDAWRVGLTWFVKGHNANVKIGYERVSPDDPAQEDVDTFGIGFFMTY